MHKKKYNHVRLVTVADWDSIGRVITQTRGRAFSFFLKPQKLGWAERFNGSAACFVKNARPSLLIDEHTKSFWQSGL